jgi:hypothetical protein
MFFYCLPFKTLAMERKHAQENESLNQTSTFQLFDAAFKSHEAFESLRLDHNGDLLADTYSWLSISLVVFVFFGFFGNLMVCLAIKLDPKLQNTTNFYLLSLAITDLLVSVIVIPLAIVKLVFSKCHMTLFLLFFDSLDSLTCS